MISWFAAFTGTALFAGKGEFNGDGPGGMWKNQGECLCVERSPLPAGRTRLFGPYSLPL
jgi:hypothetical protein